MDDEKGKFRFIRGKILSGRVYPEIFTFHQDDNVLNIGCGEGAQAVVYSGQYRKMIGIDINKVRLERSKEAMNLLQVYGYSTVVANVEKMPFNGGTFDKAIAVDIIEHVQSPRQLCREANRILSDNGEILVTFPAMHDKFTGMVTAIVRIIKKNKQKKDKAELIQWNPDAHNQNYSVGEWIKIIEESGFKLTRMRASTLFPPLHLYGIPRFWFANNFIHRIDSWLCRLPVLRNLGQSMGCVFKKQNQC